MNHEAFPKRFSENIWMLGNSGYPFFLVKGRDACALVEGSLSCLASMALSQMESLRPLPPLRRLVVAHEHSDHVCGFIRLKEAMPDLILHGSKTAAQILAKEKVMAKFAFEDKMFGDLLVSLQLAVESPGMLEPKPMNIDRIMAPGQTLDLGGTVITAIDAPGHSPGQLAFFVEPDQTLLLSDAAGLGISPKEIYPLFFYSFEGYVRTLENLKDTRPRRLAMAHDITVEGPEDSLDFIDCAIRAALDMREDAAARARQGASTEDAAREWAQRMRPFGLFDRFPLEQLMSYTSLLVKRALEA